MKAEESKKFSAKLFDQSAYMEQLQKWRREQFNKAVKIRDRFQRRQALDFLEKRVPCEHEFPKEGDGRCKHCGYFTV